jgi:hypothetical protein
MCGVPSGEQTEAAGIVTVYIQNGCLVCELRLNIEQTESLKGYITIPKLCSTYERVILELYIA